MLSTILSQLGAILFAIAFALQQSSAVKIARDYVPVNNPYMKRYHQAGAMVALLFCFQSPGLLIFINLFWYWLVFDIALNKMTGKDWFYTGNTSWIDRKLNSWFLHDEAGEVKAALCLSAIIILNIIKEVV